MILGALLGTLFIYLAGVLILRLRTSEYCIADLGFIFITLGFCYTAAPAITFLFLELESVPGWPWMELNRLRPNENALAAHLWRHNLFLGVFLATYIFVRGRVHIPSFKIGIAGLRQYCRSSDVLIFIIFFCIASIVRRVLEGGVDHYSDKYLIAEGLGQIEKFTLAIVNRVAAGAQYFIIFGFSLLPVSGWIKLLGFCSLIVIQLLMSEGSRIELLFLLLGSGVAYSIFVQKVKLKYLYICGLFALFAMWFIEAYRHYDFDLALTFDHFKTFGINPMGELGAVFFTGFHLYSLAEMGQLPFLDSRIFYYDILSLFSSNSNTEFSPQYWYWNQFYPGSLVPPQTNGPIADSALWGMGLMDLAVRACLIGLMFGWVARIFFRRQPSIFWSIVYIFYCATSVMTLKYGVFWQLNPIFKTILPLLLAYYLYRYLFMVDSSLRIKLP